MQHATISVLTALHALSHRIALTEGDLSAIEASGGSLTPALWERTLGLLVEARGRAGPVDLDLGYSELIHSWLGVADEAGFRERFGMGVREALVADAAQLYHVARAVDNPQFFVREAVRCQITVTWCDRAHLLLPENAAAAIEAIEAALVHCPADETWHARLYEALARAAAVTGDRSREANAKARLAVLRGDHGPVEEHVQIAAAQLLSILWCRTHAAYQLPAERGLDLHIVADPSVWRHARHAIDAGRLDQVPIPGQGFAAWTSRSALAVRVGWPLEALRGVEVVLDPADLRGFLARAGSRLASLAAVVESVWSGVPGGLVDVLHGPPVAAVVVARRRTIEDDWESVSGGSSCPWLEVYQGPARKSALECVALVELLHPALARAAAYDLTAGALVAIDHVASALAQGDIEAHRVALGHAVALTDQLPVTSDWFGYGRVRCALHAWRCGDADQALKALGRLGTQASGEAMEAIQARSDARSVAGGLEERWRAEPCLDTGSRAVWAHHEAGHVLRARELASEMTFRWPDDGAAWAVLAALLCAQARYRDARFVARTALARGYDPDEGGRLVERVERGLSGEASAEKALGLALVCACEPVRPGDE